MKNRRMNMSLRIPNKKDLVAIALTGALGLGSTSAMAAVYPTMKPR